ncbi:DUF2564 family protein [Ectobacillus sp. JY-23]|uniref:DUF2564 family protein n=1 Tax=Ectobacillus sp. JY-23 TaxID=2933872 RepID=UPI001FF47C38|nr:DUF2564 family protein [Ectobacillus sp. JY-23]UOY93405.1 DUF2564 family protein [Ectobacillus sp. JY-23]
MSRPFNGFEQVSMKVEAAQQMVGSATVSLDPEFLEHAATAVSEARAQLESMKQQATELDTSFLQEQETKLASVEHQLREANH